MPVKVNLQIFFATLLCISFFSFAETVQHRKIAYTKLNGSLMPVIQIDGEDFNGFIACYSHDYDMPSYPVGGDIHVKGFVAMRGLYKGRIFHPEGYLYQSHFLNP
ncbi:hypothetical protein [Endozoicomonas atrinae]|uniref:hypothetical protein n=1 Tax=Endozoicomonas atrinae TaxID=1333660 RepID=UPI000ABBE9BE|nr:hypothetical protein [Endozoicomonas atrinae]